MTFRLLLLIALPLFFITNTVAQDQAGVFEIPFFTHIQIEVPEENVFIETGSGIVRLPTPSDPLSTLNLPLFSTAEEVNAAMPDQTYSKGVALSISYGDWITARASGIYTQQDETSSLQIIMEDLIPNAVYTLWCTRMDVADPVDTPCGTADGSQSAFVSDDEGSTTIQFALEEPLLVSPEALYVIALAYHSDGQTYGVDPGEYGKNAHIQLLGLLPFPNQ